MRNEQDSRRRFLGMLGLGLGSLYLSSITPAFANAAKTTTPKNIRPVIRGRSHIVMDVTSGRIFAGADTDELRYPASLTKVMTALLAFDALREKRVDINDPVKFSKRAAETENVRLNVGAGNSLPLHDALVAMCTLSSNDVAVAIAEHISGTVENFVSQMNTKAAMVHMPKTQFYDPAGLNRTFQRSTAKDMAQLARHVALFYPEYMDYFNHASFTYKGRARNNVNRLVRDPDAPGGTIRASLDKAGLTPIGMKTGFIRNANHNLISMISDENGNKILAVGFGGGSQDAMAERLSTLMIDGYNDLRLEHGVDLSKPLPYMPDPHKSLLPPVMPSVTPRV